jgi:hypothetical protein
VTVSPSPNLLAKIDQRAQSVPIIRLAGHRIGRLEGPIDGRGDCANVIQGFGDVRFARLDRIGAGSDDAGN